MPSTASAAIAAAISDNSCLRIWYAPGSRLIEPHTLGRGSDGQLLLRAYQVEGASSSGEHKHWKLFRLDRMRDVERDTEASEAPRPGYKRGDQAMTGGIIREI